MRNIMNPYNPGTIAYRILEGDGTWDNMDLKEIADKLGCAYKSAEYGFRRIKRDLNYTVKKRNGKRAPEIYWPDTKIGRLYNGEWSRKTIREIALEIGASEKTVNAYISRIEEETGKYINHLDGRKVRCKRGKAET